MSSNVKNFDVMCGACPLRESEENRLLPECGRSGIIRRVRLCRNASVAESDGGHRLSIVRAGEIKAERLARSGDARVLGFFVAGDAVAVPAGRNVPTIFTALEPAELCEMDIAKAERTLPDSTGFLRAVVEIALHQIKVAQEQAERFHTGSARDRLAAFLADRAARSGRRGAELTLPMSREDLARFLAMRPETLSRAFADLRSEGRIETPSRSVVKLVAPEAPAHPSPKAANRAP